MLGWFDMITTLTSQGKQERDLEKYSSRKYVKNIQREFRSMGSNGWKKKGALFMTCRQNVDHCPGFLAVTIVGGSCALHIVIVLQIEFIVCTSSIFY